MGRKGKRLLAGVRRWLREANGWKRPLTNKEIWKQINSEEDYELPESWLKEFGLETKEAS